MSNREAAAAEREIEADHFGITVLLAENGVPDELADRIRRQRPDTDPAELVAGSWSALHRLVDSYLDAGLSKFVVVPARPDPLDGFLERFASELVPRRNGSARPASVKACRHVASRRRFGLRR